MAKNKKTRSMPQKKTNKQTKTKASVKKTLAKSVVKSVKKSVAKVAKKKKQEKPVAKVAAKKTGKKAVKKNAKLPIKQKIKSVEKKTEKKAKIKKADKPAEKKKSAKAVKPVKVAKSIEKPLKKIKSVKPNKVAKSAKVKPVEKLPKTPKLPKQENDVTNSVFAKQNAKFIKVPFFFDVGERDDKNSKSKHGATYKPSDKPTIYRRVAVNGIESSDTLSKLIVQLESAYEVANKSCEGLVCIKCNVNPVDPKFFVDDSLGYCAECAALLRLGESREGVFSETAMELMRRQMETGMDDFDDDDATLEKIIASEESEDDILENEPAYEKDEE